MNRIVLITGMSGSGKSTVGRSVAEHFSKSMHIRVDQIREMMVKGMDVPGENGFTEATYQQFQWARFTAIIWHSYMQARVWML